MEASMPKINAGTWKRYDQPFRVFGPLMRVSEIAAQAPQAGFDHYNDRQKAALRKMADYAYSFLSNPHPDLGREGSVCPFVPTAIRKGLLRATATSAASVETAEAAMTAILSVFAAMKPVSPPFGTLVQGDESFKAILIVFPEVSESAAPQVVDELQRRLKPAYVKSGLMIGQFHPTCPDTGLHNPHFRPLQAPVPSLAIRHVTKFDAPFMDRDEYIDAYLRLFGLEGFRRIHLLEKTRSGNTCPSHLLKSAA
jgi:hypothetical protein